MKPNEYWNNIFFVKNHPLGIDDGEFDGTTCKRTRSEAIDDIADVNLSVYDYVHTIHVKDGVAEIVDLEDEADKIRYADCKSGDAYDRRRDEQEERDLEKEFGK